MKQLMTAFLLVFLGILKTAWAEDFRVRLGIEGGQVRELILGVQKTATDGIDEKLDILVPPFGMGTGTVGLVPEDSEKSLLYRDVRGPALPKTWRVALAPAQRPVMLTWVVAELPPDTDCQLECEGIKIDMRQQSRLSVRKKTILLLTISPKKKP